MFVNDWNRNPMPFVTLRRDSRRKGLVNQPQQFYMSFMLKRLLVTSASNESPQWDEVETGEYSFVRLNEQKSTGQSFQSESGASLTSTYYHYYLMGINDKGYLTLKRIRRELVNKEPKHGDLFSGLNNPASSHPRSTESILWSLVDDKVNLNNLTTETAADDSSYIKISLKISDPFVQLSVNDTFTASYELVTSNSSSSALAAAVGEIGELRFGYNSFAPSSSAKPTRHRPQSFIISDLSIDGFNYDLATATNTDQPQLQQLQQQLQSPLDYMSLPTSSDDYFALNVLNKQSGHLLIRNEKQQADDKDEYVFNLLNVNSIDLFKESTKDDEIMIELSQSYFNRNCSYEPGAMATAMAASSNGTDHTHYSLTTGQR